MSEKILVIISPSQQQNNVCKAGDKEADHTREIAEKLYNLIRNDTRIEAVLVPKMYDIPETGYKRLTAICTYTRDIALKSTCKQKIRLAIHTDATGTNAVARGTSVFWKPGDTTAEKIASQIMKSVSAVSGRRRTYAPKSYSETMVYGTTNVLVELDFHDNVLGANFIHKYKSEFAESLRVGLYNSIFNSSAKQTVENVNVEKTTHEILTLASVNVPLWEKTLKNKREDIFKYLDALIHIAYTQRSGNKETYTDILKRISVNGSAWCEAIPKQTDTYKYTGILIERINSIKK